MERGRNHEADGMSVIRFLRALFALVIFVASVSRAATAQTTYILPRDVPWKPLVEKGVPPGAFSAFLRGKASDKCDELIRYKFPSGFVYPWHVNHVSGIYTIVQGTLVIGFDAHHRASAEKTLPAGSVMQGLATEPHYGRAVGETIFDFYGPCP